MNDRSQNILDLTYPGACEYLEEQFRKISRDWGYKYFKFDFMRSVFVPSDQQFYDRTTTSLEAYRKGLEAIRRGVGQDAYISVCGGHYGASLGIADSQRSGSDVKSNWSKAEIPKYRQNILRTWMSDLWHVDPDAMMVRRQENQVPGGYNNLSQGLFTDEEAFTNAINQFIGGNLITFTEDFSIIDHDRKMLYKHVLPSVNSSSKPIDLFNIVIPEIMITPIIPMCKELGKWNMLSVINWSDESKDYSIELDSGLTGNLEGDHFIIYDFRTQSITGILSPGQKLKIDNVQGHQSRLMKIVPWNGKSPMFLGTDLNFSCGGMEISDLKCTGTTLSGNINTDWDIPVKLVFVVPTAKGYEVKVIEQVKGQKKFFFDF
jgi:hypothetical protein